MAKTKPLTSIDESGFVITPQLRKWTEDKYPTLDIDATYEEFVLVYQKNGHMWASWTAVWKQYLARSIKNNWGGVIFKQGTENPAFAHLAEEARAKGFRQPHKFESVGAYRTALKQYEPNVVPIRREA